MMFVKGLVFFHFYIPLGILLINVKQIKIFFFCSLLYYVFLDEINVVNANLKQIEVLSKHLFNSQTILFQALILCTVVPLNALDSETFVFQN